MQRGMIDADLPKAVLELDKLREVGDELRLARLPKPDRREDQTAGNGRRGQGLQDDLNDLERGRHR